METTLTATGLVELISSVGLHFLAHSVHFNIFFAAEGQWQWVSGDAWGFETWHEGEPNNVDNEVNNGIYHSNPDYSTKYSMSM